MISLIRNALIFAIMMHFYPASTLQALYVVTFVYALARVNYRLVRGIWTVQ